VRAQPRHHVALSPKGILLSLPHTQIIRIETHNQRIQRKVNKRKTAEKHLLKALILFCDKFCANLENTPEKQKMALK
jgi:hypothetical protein